MALAVEVAVALDPVNAASFRATRHVPAPTCLAKERDKLLGFPTLPKVFRHWPRIAPPVTLFVVNSLTQFRARLLSKNCTECVHVVTSCAAASTVASLVNFEAWGFKSNAEKEKHHGY